MARVSRSYTSSTVSSLAGPDIVIRKLAHIHAIAYGNKFSKCYLHYTKLSAKNYKNKYHMFSRYHLNSGIGLGEYEKFSTGKRLLVVAMRRQLYDCNCKFCQFYLTETSKFNIVRKTKMFCN